MTPDRAGRERFVPQSGERRVPAEIEHNSDNLRPARGGRSDDGLQEGAITEVGKHDAISQRFALRISSCDQFTLRRAEPPLRFRRQALQHVARGLRLPAIAADDHDGVVARNRADDIGQPGAVDCQCQGAAPGPGRS